MKKKTISNLIMVLTIALIVAVGALIAWFLIEPEESLFGSAFCRTEIAENRLVQNENTENLCTITIRCDTIFDNAASLEEAKFPYVPEDGEILPVVTVEFTPGETVFDVLNRVCEAADLQIEYSWTPLYNIHYIIYRFKIGLHRGQITAIIFKHRINNIICNVKESRQNHKDHQHRKQSLNRTDRKAYKFYRKLFLFDFTFFVFEDLQFSA